MGDAAHEEHDGGGVEESARRVDSRLEVLCQAPIAPDPGEETLDDPAARVNGETDLIGILAHDFDGNQRGRSDLFTRISAVSEDPLDEREDAARDAQKRSAAIAILDACRMRFEHQATSIRVDQSVALAPVDLLARIVAARPVRSRSRITKAWLIFSKRPSSRKFANQR